MKPEWCPQWAWDEAKERSKNSFLSFDLDEAHEVVAHALLDAHQRDRREGMEEAAAVARCAFDDRPRRSNMDWVDGFDDGTKAAHDAIRAKAQELKT